MNSTDLSAGIDFRVAPMRPQAPLPGEPMREWTLPEGGPWTRFYRTPSGFLLRFPDLADFEVSEDGGTVRSWPAPGVSDGSIQHLYLNQVLPLALSTRGRLVFHASAVDLGGLGVAFMGGSGMGKSTLAASFAANGFAFLCDDGLVVETGGAGASIVASHPSIRLWDDSRSAVIGAGLETAPAVDYTAKERFLAGDALRFCGEARPLHRVYFLGEADAERTSIELLSPGEALIHLVRHSFLLDVHDPQLLAAHFDRLSALASGRACHRLAYPRRFDELGRVRRDILVHTRGGEAA